MRIALISMAVSFLISAGCVSDLSWHPVIAFSSLLVFAISVRALIKSDEYVDLIKEIYEEI